MSQLYDKIFNEEGSLSKQELLAYLRDELSNSDRNRIERILEASPLDREALEGLEAHPDSWKVMDQLTPPNSLMAKSSGISASAWWTIGIAATLITAGVFIFWPTDIQQPQIAENQQPVQELEKQDDATADDLKDKTAPQPTEREITAEEETVPTETEQIEVEDEPQPGNLTETQTILPKADVAPQENLIAQEDSIYSEELEELGISATTAMNTTSANQELNTDSELVDETSTPEIEINEIDKDLIAYVNVGSTHYKVVNYEVVERPEKVEDTDEQKERQKMLEELSRSTPPRFGNQHETFKNEDKSISQYTLNLNYDFVLRSAMEAFNKGETRLAMQRFDLILNQFPNDQNALFYSSLILKEELNTEIAEKRLLKVLEQEPNIFGEEANWELAKLYSAQGKTEQAKNQLQKIIEEGGFYTNQAQQLLLKIED